MGDDIREIESQNGGLQILAQNQHNLGRELDDLLVKKKYDTLLFKLEVLLLCK